MRARYDVFVKYEERNLYPTFTEVKHLKNMNKKILNRYHRSLLLDEISNEHKWLKVLSKQLVNGTDPLNFSLTWMNHICIS